MKLSKIEIKPTKSAKFGIIWLHGLGANGHDFESLVPELNFPDKDHTHFIFPNAPIQPVTINQGMRMPSWYDIYAISTERDFNQDDLKQSATAIQALIAELINSGIPSHKILLAGFSQGGAVALEAALTFEQPLAALLCLSTYFATEKTIQRNSENHGLSIEVHHGLQDPVVPEVLGQRSVNALKAMGHPVTYKTYGMPHAVCPPQVKDISNFIQRSLQ